MYQSALRMTFVSFFLLVFFSYSVTAQNMGPSIGSYDKDKHSYWLVFSFGMDVYEDGKLLTNEREDWFLMCIYPDLQVQDKTKTSCNLDTKLFIPLGNDTKIDEDMYSSGDGNMKIKDADWTNGRLDFSLRQVGDTEPTEVSIRMTYDQSGYPHLDSFRAVTVEEDPISKQLSVWEFKIPIYTYTINYPVVFKGMKSESARALDAMIQSLNDKDRVQWEKIKENLVPELDVIKRALPNWADIDSGKKQATDADWTRVRTALNAELEKRLPTSGLSPDGQRKVREYLEKAFAEEFK